MLQTRCASALTRQMQDALPVDAAKTALRIQIRKRRASITPDSRMKAAADLAKHGLDFLDRSNAPAVSGYYPVRDELDCRPLLKRLEDQGMGIALPVTIRDSKDLHFRAWTCDAPTVVGDFGIPVPSQRAPEIVPKIVLTPLLAFDHQGYRLGYGGGYYDRALARLALEGRVVAVGLAFDCQQVEAVPHEPSDYRLDWVLTPSGPRKTGS